MSTNLTLRVILTLRVRYNNVNFLTLRVILTLRVATYHGQELPHIVIPDVCRSMLKAAPKIKSHLIYPNMYQPTITNKLSPTN